jgi:hypothetical protein
VCRWRCRSWRGKASKSGVEDKTLKVKKQKLKVQRDAWLWLGLCVCAFASEGWCAQKGAGIAHAAAPPEYRIAGVVVDAETGAAIAGADLSIEEGSADLAVKADEEGRFVFEGMEPGKYSVAASAPGYVQERYQQHGQYSTAMAVGPGVDSEQIVFRLHRQAVIAGTVTDERGEAVRKAQVMLFAEQRGAGKHVVQMSLQTETDDLGAYRFAHLAAGKYYVAVTARPWYAQTRVADPPAMAEGVGFADRGPAIPQLDVVYPTTFYPGVTDEQSAGELMVSVGETTQADVRLQAVPSMHVRVTNVAPANPENGESTGIGAIQSLFGSAGAGLPVVMAQIAPGVYEVGGLPPGPVKLTLNENHNGEWENRTIHVNASDGETVDARATGATANVLGRVAPAEGTGGSLRGEVVLSSKDGQTISKNMQKDGSFSIAALEVGTYEVSVNLNGDGASYVERLAATGAKVSGGELTIEEPGEVRLTVQMGRGFGEVKGVVKAEGKSEAGAMVLLVPASGGNLERDARMDQSDSDGTFTLGRVLPGKYVLVAIEDGWDLDWTDAAVLAPYREKGQTIEIGANEVKHVAVEAEKKVVSNQ